MISQIVPVELPAKVKSAAVENRDGSFDVYVNTTGQRNEFERLLLGMNQVKKIAFCLLTGIPEFIEVVNGYDKDDFMEALEVLEQHKRKYPGDSNGQTAIEFIKSNFPSLETSWDLEETQNEDHD